MNTERWLAQWTLHVVHNFTVYLQAGYHTSLARRTGECFPLHIPHATYFVVIVNIHNGENIGFQNQDGSSN